MTTNSGTGIKSNIIEKDNTDNAETVKKEEIGSTLVAGSVTGSGNGNENEKEGIDNESKAAESFESLEENIILAIKEKNLEKIQNFVLALASFIPPPSNDENEKGENDDQEEMETKNKKKKSKILNKALFFAIESLAVDIVSFLIDLGDHINVNSSCIDPNSKYSTFTPLIYTCIKILKSKESEAKALCNIIEILSKRGDLLVNGRGEAKNSTTTARKNEKTSEEEDYSTYPAIVLLAIANDLEGMKTLIENRPKESEKVDINLSISEERKDTALHYAAGNNNLNMVQYLLSHSDIDPNVCSILRTPLILSCSLNLIDITKALLNCPRVDVNYATEEDKATALILASKLGHQDQVKVLLQHPNIDVNLRSKFGDTALIWAISANQIGIAKILLTKSSIDINCQALNGSTALSVAAMIKRKFIESEKKDDNITTLISGHSEIIHELGSHSKLDPNIRIPEEGNDTVLMICIKNDDTEGALALLHRDDIDLTVTNDFGDVALCWAIVKQNYEVCKAIIKKSGPEISQGYWQNNINSLMLALKWSSDKIMVIVARLLLNNEHIQPAILAKSDFGDTALIWACLMGLKDIVALILEKAKPSLDYIYHESNNGSTALLCSEGGIRIEIKSLLMKYIEDQEKVHGKKNIVQGSSVSSSNSKSNTDTNTKFDPRLLDVAADYRMCSNSYQSKRGKLTKLGHKKKIFGKESWQERLFILKEDKLSYHNVTGLVESSITDTIISNTELNLITLNENCQCTVKHADDTAFGDRFASHKDSDPEHCGTVGKDNCIELRVLPPPTADRAELEVLEREHRDHHDCFRTFYLHASNLKEAEEWVQAINHNIYILKLTSNSSK